MKLSYRDLCRAWGIDEQEHRLLFEWLMQDPRDEQGRLTREIGLTKLGGTPEKIEACAYARRLGAWQYFLSARWHTFPNS